ncbi:MAG: hypothetical protein HYR74_03400 [Candidatus Eisenbacteria bacterium]|nr:hypothetical protein [Candidatus Eisenbacteria bacterium]
MLGLLAAVLAVWLVETGGHLWRTSHWDQYVYLADAFNHGSLALVHRPADAGDMAVIGGRLFVVFGPLPALPLMPFVAWLGPATPDVLALVITALFGILCVHRFMVAVHGARDRLRLAAATLTFALGTAIHYGTPMGNVWLHALITATALQCAALWMAAIGRPWLAGAALGLTVLARSTVTLAAPCVVWLLLDPPAPAGEPERAPRATPWRIGLALGAPVAIAAAIHAAYNVARFGSVQDAGYHYILMGDVFQKLVERYGRFSLHYLPQNLTGLLLRPPAMTNGVLAPDPHGMSLLLTTPYLLLALVPRKVTRLEWVALATIMVIAAPALLYYNDGWVQFGQRFALDWIALGLLVASFGAMRAPRWAVAALAAAGIGVGVWGCLWFSANFLH